MLLIAVSLLIVVLAYAIWAFISSMSRQEPPVCGRT